MKVASLDSSLEPMFWEHINQDIPDYYFFILDVKRYRASTNVWLALNKENRIEGMMLIYRRSIVQLRGSVEAARALLSEFDIEKAEITGSEEHRALILDKFKRVKKISELILMTLRKGKETLHTKHRTVRLSVADADGIAALMRHADPDWWGGVTAERIAEGMKDHLWLGIKVDGNLVSVGGATLDDWGSNVGTVVTHERHRNKGYATSIVSALVNQIFQKSSLALIHVESDNHPAIRAYTKVGFKPYKKYFFARVEKS